ncbi:hypothetical protein HG535_0G04100 [Zygotorulaspora mrakii]|uniref:RNA exonuclease 3 n=1 Tax=Zygotorulaspora mrakii TaxID=42260 RepID=A0A7H9B7F0_ZYGMR|nr:uncharacterized protein HG535_0G04100 [Zygotorulaspora mrakii]QLG74527.1 hypothetical protein HG535_0G04100 [Zygotorulaspora mrakii]
MSHPLRPIDLVRQPAPFQDRYKILQKLLAHLQKVKPNAAEKLNKLAVGLEARVAKSSSSPQSYRFNMSILMRDLTKYKGDLSQIRVGQKPIVARDKTRPSNITKLNAMEKLKAVIIDTEVLKKNGYIIGKETTEDPADLIYTTCIRCNTKFEKAKIMENAFCRYHISKKQFDKVSKTYQYPCCGETTVSTSFLRLGCQTQNHHVFRSETYEELSTISKFISTDNYSGEENVLALDCEMAFTSLGYEMIRLTIVDFFTSKTLFDEIIRPIGEVIDLNSQFSGVHEICESNSMSYHEAMRKVVSEKLINKNTILIGHGLENDLNVMRIVHKKIIDTAILYSKGRYKSSLKNFAFEFLSREIQNGEHDSSEDAIATMDVVKVRLGIPVEQTGWD